MLRIQDLDVSNWQNHCWNEDMTGIPVCNDKVNPLIFTKLPPIQSSILLVAGELLPPNCLLKY